MLMRLDISTTIIGKLTTLLLTSATLINRTIFDTYGDSTTGNGIVYNVDPAWPKVWRAVTAASQSSVAIKFDAAQMFMGTWHDVQVASGTNQSRGMDISVSFTGAFQHNHKLLHRKVVEDVCITFIL